MTKDPRTVEVDLGEHEILVLKFKRILNAAQRANVQKTMEMVAATPGRQTIVLEDGCQYSVIRRESATKLEAPT